MSEHTTPQPANYSAVATMFLGIVKGGVVVAAALVVDAVAGPLVGAVATTAAADYAARTIADAIGPLTTPTASNPTAGKKPAEKPASAQAEKGASEKPASGQTQKGADEKLAKEQAEKVAAEKLAKEQADKVAAEKLAKEQVEKVAAEKLAKEQADKVAAEKLAKEQADKVAAEKLAKEQAEKVAAEKLAKEQADKVAAEKLAKEQVEKVAAEKLAKEQAMDKVAAEKLAKEQADKVAAEKLAKEQAEKVAAEKLAKEQAEKVAAEKLAKEQADKFSAEKLAKEQAEKEGAKKAAALKLLLPHEANPGPFDSTITLGKQGDPSYRIQPPKGVDYLNGKALKVVNSDEFENLINSDKVTFKIVGKASNQVYEVKIISAGTTMPPDLSGQVKADLGSMKITVHPNATKRHTFVRNGSEGAAYTKQQIISHLKSYTGLVAAVKSQDITQPNTWDYKVTVPSGDRRTDGWFIVMAYNPTVPDAVLVKHAGPG